MQQGLGSSTWWEEAEYTQLETANLRALFVLDKLIKRDIATKNRLDYTRMGTVPRCRIVRAAIPVLSNHRGIAKVMNDGPNLKNQVIE